MPWRKRRDEPVAHEYEEDVPVILPDQTARGSDLQYDDPAYNEPTPARALSPVRAAADANAVAEPEDYDWCPTCGRATPTIRELLSDTLNQVATRAPQVFGRFYERVFSERPDLEEMFPAELTDPDSSGAGKAQREKLLNASVAVATHYNPDSPDSMRALNAALDDMGAKHGESRFSVADPDWPNGRRPLLQREYDVINKHLIATLKEFQGESWTTLHTAAWWKAMTYVADRMGATQILGLSRHAR
jgi:hemoglobin-like flavoprotein